MTMDVYFDNKANILNASLKIERDDSIIYTVKTTFSGFTGRQTTVLRDENPAPGKSSLVGIIHWREKIIEIGGHKRPVSEIRRTERGLFKRKQFWRWSEQRKEYLYEYHHEGWKAIMDDGTSLAAEFSVPSRPHLFSETKTPVLCIARTALADEVFLILTLIYSEIKRQDRTNSSSANGGVGW